jgi:hypothetical protein
MTSSQNPRSSPRLSDEELEYYGNLYVRCAIREAGVDFESFLNNPEYYLRKHAQGHPAAAGTDGDGRRKGLRSHLRLRQAARTSIE